MTDGSVLGQAGVVSAAPTQPLASTTSAHINGPAKLSSNSTMQQAQGHVEKVPATAEQPRPAAAPPALGAPVVAGHISAPAATAVAAPAAAPAQATGNGLTRLERETALFMLNLLAKYKEADPFRAPVDWEALGIPDYPVIIKHPMDLKTAREKVRAGAYKSMDEWRADIKRIWDNCRKYNGENHPVTRCAEKLEAAMERRMEEAVAGAARELSTAQQRADASGGLAGKGAAGGSRPRAPREVALLRASNTSAGSDSDGGEDGRQAGAAARTVTRQQHQQSPEPMRLSLKRVASGSNVQAAGAPAGAAPPAAAGPAAVAAAAADSRAALAKRGRLASNNLSGGGGSGVPAAAIAAAAGAAAGSMIPGVDYDALEQLSNTQAAKQLGTSDADDLAFLAVWKRVIAKRTQAASEAEGLRQASKKLKRSLLTSEEEARQLRGRLDEEAAARAEAEQQLKELQVKHTKLQEQHKEQHKVLEHQRQLLEQQQQVLRQVLKQQQQSQQQPAQQQAAPQQQDAPQPVLRMSVAASEPAAAARPISQFAARKSAPATGGVRMPPPALQPVQQPHLQPKPEHADSPGLVSGADDPMQQ